MTQGPCQGGLFFFFSLRSLQNSSYHLQITIIKNGTYKKAISVFPSTTGPAYLPFLMGTYPGKANMPGIRWLDKLSFADNPNSSNSHRSYVGYETKYFNIEDSVDLSEEQLEHLQQTEERVWRSH